MGLISAVVKIEVAIPVSCMRGAGGRTPQIAGEVRANGSLRVGWLTAWTTQLRQRLYGLG